MKLVIKRVSTYTEFMERYVFFRFLFVVSLSLAAWSFGYGLAGQLVKTDHIWLTDSARPDGKRPHLVNVFEDLGSPPPPPSMERMKREGCIADGFLSGYGHESTNIEMVNRLSCYSFHRALETWLEPPDFKRAKSIMDKVQKPVVVWGMFLAEAINVKQQYYFPDEDRMFDFYDMCRPDTKNRWGEHTCVPFTDRKEYRLYLKYITRQAMDIGIQNFMFGQVGLQDDLSKDRMSDIIKQMRKDAKERGIEIVIGAQTNDIDDPKYLKLFDYIEGGVGVNSDGEVEDGPCFSRWWKKEGDWCWALLWNDRFSTKANNVWVHLDWSGRRGDDMSTFARMSAQKRADTLKSLYKKFTGEGIGFLLPVMTALPERNGGCYGELERFYSANNKFGCKDEKAINGILKGAWK